MNKKPLLERIGALLEGKGFYIVLFLCVAAIGTSGYIFISSINQLNDIPASRPIQVTVTPEVSQVPAPQASIVPEAPVVESPRPTVPAPSAALAPADLPAPSEEEDVPEETPHEPEVEPSHAPSLYVWPVMGEVIGAYSLEVLAYDETMGDWRTHSGVDIQAELGTEVGAITDGTVIAVEVDALMGPTVMIDHGENISSIYSSLGESPMVEVGDEVTAGQVIGVVADTAPAEAALPSHLHFEMRDGNLAIDPIAFLPPVS